MDAEPHPLALRGRSHAPCIGQRLDQIQPTAAEVVGPGLSRRGWSRILISHGALDVGVHIEHDHDLGAVDMPDRVGRRLGHHQLHPIHPIGPTPRRRNCSPSQARAWGTELNAAANVRQRTSRLGGADVPAPDDLSS